MRGSTCYGVAVNRQPLHRCGPGAGDPTDPMDPGGSDGERQGDLATEERVRTKKPRQFKVVLHNDNYTTMEFVVLVLMQFLCQIMMRFIQRIISYQLILKIQVRIHLRYQQ